MEACDVFDESDTPKIQAEIPFLFLAIINRQEGDIQDFQANYKKQ